ncbi:MAG TPA: hypothetical protein VKS81_10130, partial [Bacteroidota bacterium]|nr:hypothetical protein [Bacteroidota bacterium]
RIASFQGTKVMLARSLKNFAGDIFEIRIRQKPCGIKRGSLDLRLGEGIRHFGDDDRRSGGILRRQLRHLLMRGASGQSYSQNQEIKKKLQINPLQIDEKLDQTIEKYMAFGMKNQVKCDQN